MSRRKRLFYDSILISGTALGTVVLVWVCYGSAGVAGLAGVVLALTAGIVAPGAFPLSLSFALITGAVIAGISSLLPGSVVGAVVLVGMSQLVGTFTSRFQIGDILAENLKELIVSALLILAVVFTPNGPGEKIRAMREHRKHHSHGGVR